MHRGFAGKPLKTDGTLVRLQTQVDVQVVLEVVRVGKSLAALLASERLLVIGGVFLVNVPSHFFLRANPSTLLTLGCDMNLFNVQLQKKQRQIWIILYIPLFQAFW